VWPTISPTMYSTPDGSPDVCRFSGEASKGPHIGVSSWLLPKCQESRVTPMSRRPVLIVPV
jgi:hypothetical protein